MAKLETLILTNGGMRSLVATASAVAVAGDQAPVQLALLHIRDRRANAGTRLACVHDQAQRLGLRRIIELAVPGFEPKLSLQMPEDTRQFPLVYPRLMLAALTQAIELGVAKIVWPVQVGPDSEAITRLTEQEVLLRDVAGCEMAGGAKPPTFDMPLLELTDQQIVELGQQLGVPWELAWSCFYRGERPCMTCEGCVSRRAAFEAAGVIDPQPKLAEGDREGSAKK